MLPPFQEHDQHRQAHDHQVYLRDQHRAHHFCGAEQDMPEAEHKRNHSHRHHWSEDHFVKGDYLMESGDADTLCVRESIAIHHHTVSNRESRTEHQKVKSCSSSSSHHPSISELLQPITWLDESRCCSESESTLKQYPSQQSTGHISEPSQPSVVGPLIQRVSTQQTHRLHTARSGDKEVRRVGAIRMLTTVQVKQQLAMRAGFPSRASLVSTEPPRSVLQAIVKTEVDAREAEHGPDAVTTDDEMERLRELGLGRQRRAPRRHARRPERRTKSTQWCSSSSSEDDEGCYFDPSLLQGNDVYKVERILDVREDSQAGREFLIKWRGWSTKWNNWEPEAHILDRRMIHRFYKRTRYTAEHSITIQDQSSLDQPPQMQPAPTRQRSTRSGARVAAEKARRAANDDAEGSDGQSESGEHDGLQAIN